MDFDKHAAVLSVARRRFRNFARYIKLEIEIKPFHEAYYRVLDMFAHGLIKKLIIQIPPQHGKSEGSSRLLPAFMLGLNPDRKICIGSYATTIAQDFNRDVQRIIDTASYRRLFPDTYLSGMNVVTMANNYLRNSNVIEMVGHNGSLRVVGRGGALTSKTVDVSILDDVYKDYAEANSPIVREAAWKWYTTVVRTRLHNESQELIVFTRWHSEDIIGRLEKSERVIDINKWDDIEKAPKEAWLRINFEALKESEPNELDSREKGESLWEERHSKKKLEAQRELDPVQFECLYQGNAESAEGRLYNEFRTWVNKEDWGRYVRSGAYIDVKDEGNDYLGAITYDIYLSPNEAWNEQKGRFEPILFALVTDIMFTDENTDITTETVPNMLNLQGTQKCWVESNNGGSLYEKAIRRKVRCQTYPFFQSANKESRIITCSAMVNQSIIMPIGWESRYPKAAEHIKGFLRNFSANAHDDIEDVMTGIYEKEIANGNTQPYSAQVRGISVR